MSSIVPALYRLYGTIQSGSSWWSFPHLSHFNRRIISFIFFSSFSFTIRCRSPRTVNFSPHIGQYPASFVLTKQKSALLLKTVTCYYYHASRASEYIISYIRPARNARESFSVVRCDSFPVTFACSDLAYTKLRKRTWIWWNKKSMRDKRIFKDNNNKREERNSKRRI